MVTRRALLGAGALSLFAGCGPDEEPKVDAAAVLGEQLRVTQAVAIAYEGVAGGGRANARDRVERLEAAVRAAGGTPAAPPSSGSTGTEAALAAESAALRAHIAAIGQLGRRDHRELLSGLVVDAATGESALLIALERPPAPSAFPGQPV